MSSTPSVARELYAGGADFHRLSGDRGGPDLRLRGVLRAVPAVILSSLVFILGIFSMAVSNLGLSHLIQISIPVLTAIYPPCIALVVLSFTRNWWHNSSRVIAPAMFISLMFGIIDGIKSSAFADMLPAWTSRLPLAEQGLAWLMPTAVMVVLAVIWDRAAGRQVTSSAH
jgi:LIVCS family branched-chain amino acid:cation transporter